MLRGRYWKQGDILKNDTPVSNMEYEYDSEEESETRTSTYGTEFIGPIPPKSGVQQGHNAGHTKLPVNDKQHYLLF